LEQFLRDHDFLGARRARFGCERDADGVADALLQQHRERGAGGDDALAADAGLGQAQVQREVAARGEVAVDRDQLLHAADLAAQDDALGRQAELDRARGRVQRRAHQRLAQHAGGVPGARRSPRAASEGSARVASSSISVAASAWSSEPQLAPMRAGLPLAMANSTSCANCRSFFLPKPTLPGLMRYLASARAQAGSFASSWWPL